MAAALGTAHPRAGFEGSRVCEFSCCWDVRSRWPGRLSAQNAARDSDSRPRIRGSAGGRGAHADERVPDIARDLSHDVDSTIDVVTSKTRRCSWTPSRITRSSAGDRDRPRERPEVAPVLLRRHAVHGLRPAARVLRDGPGARRPIANSSTELYERTGIQLPLEDLFRWADQDHSDIDKLTSAFNVGTATIDGVATDHWAFRSADFDWEIWIEQGDRPVPRKYVLIDRTDPTLARLHRAPHLGDQPGARCRGIHVRAQGRRDRDPAGHPRGGCTMKRLPTLLALGAAMVLVAGQAAEADARGRGGGGARGGGSMGMSRGGGGGSMSRSGGEPELRGHQQPSSAAAGAPRAPARASPALAPAGDGAAAAVAAAIARATGKPPRAIARADRQANQGDRQGDRETNQGDRQDGRTERQETRQTERTDRTKTRQENAPIGRRTAPTPSRTATGTTAGAAGSTTRSRPAWSSARPRCGPAR